MKPSTSVSSIQSCRMSATVAADPTITGPMPPMPPNRASSSTVQRLSGSPSDRASTAEMMALVSTFRTRSVGAYWPKSMPVHPDMKTSEPS